MVPAALDLIGLAGKGVVALDVVAHGEPQVQAVQVDGNPKAALAVPELAVIKGVDLGVGADRLGLAVHVGNARVDVDKRHARRARVVLIGLVALGKRAGGKVHVAVVGLIVLRYLAVVDAVDGKPHLVVRLVIVLDVVLGVFIVVIGLEHDGVAAHRDAFQGRREREQARVELADAQLADACAVKQVVGVLARDLADGLLGLALAELLYARKRHG